MHNALLQQQQVRVQQARPDEVEKLLQENFLLVSFWTKADYFAFTATNKDLLSTDSGKKSQLPYVQFANGQVVDRNTVISMYAHARYIFARFKIDKVAPASFGKLDIVSRAYFHTEMKKEYPCLGYCEGNWKTERLGTHVYPQWMKAIRKAEVTAAGKLVVDSEAASGDVEMQVDSRSTKRERTLSQSHATVPTKKQRRQIQEKTIDPHVAPARATSAQDMSLSTTDIAPSALSGPPNATMLGASTAVAASGPAAMSISLTEPRAGLISTSAVAGTGSPNTTSADASNLHAASSTSTVGCADSNSSSANTGIGSSTAGVAGRLERAYCT